jgi:hypothetical protein
MASAVIIVTSPAPIARVVLAPIVLAIGSAALPILAALLGATFFHATHVGAVLGRTPLRIAPFFRALSFGAALLGPTGFNTPLFGTSPFGVAAGLATALLRASLGDAPLFRATFGLATFGAIPFGTIAIVATRWLRVCRIARRPVHVPHSVFAQLYRLVSEDDPAPIVLVVPTPVDQIRRTAVVFRPRIALDARRRLHVRHRIIVHDLAPRVRHAAWHHRCQRQADSEVTQPAPHFRCLIPCVDHGFLRSV